MYLYLLIVIIELFYHQSTINTISSTTTTGQVLFTSSLIEPKYVSQSDTFVQQIQSTNRLLFSLITHQETHHNRPSVQITHQLNLNPLLPPPPPQSATQTTSLANQPTIKGENEPFQFLLLFQHITKTEVCPIPSLQTKPATCSVIVHLLLCWPKITAAAADISTVATATVSTTAADDIQIYITQRTMAKLCDTMRTEKLAHEIRNQQLNSTCPKNSPHWPQQFAPVR